MYRGDGDRDVVHDCRHGLPERQWQSALRVEWYHDRIARLDRYVRSLLESSITFLRYHAPVGTHNVDSTLVGTSGHASARGDAIVASQSWVIQVRGQIPDLAEYHHPLLQLRNT